MCSGGVEVDEHNAYPQTTKASLQVMSDEEAGLPLSDDGSDEEGAGCARRWAHSHEVQRAPQPEPEEAELPEGWQAALRWLERQGSPPAVRSERQRAKLRLSRQAMQVLPKDQEYWGPDGIWSSAGRRSHSHSPY